jgi:WhiB family redox-sensing transcriptional regulator
MATPVSIGPRPKSPNDEEWKLDAACAEVGGDFWFPEAGGSTAEAKLVCARCPATAACLEYALAIGARHGVWGGKSERERRALARTSAPLADAA